MAVDVVKLRMKIGVHELEAEGPRDVVTAQLQIWTRLAGLGATDDSTAADSEATLPALFAVDAAQKQIALRIKPQGRRRNADAALLILYGYRTCFAGADGGEVPAARLKAALAASGHRLQRVDRALAPHLAAGWVRKGGRHKHETYALTVPGHEHAAALARQLSPQQ